MYRYTFHLMVEVYVAKRVWRTIRTHKRTGLADITHIVHNTESKVHFNPLGCVHPLSDGIHEGINLALIKLWGSIEIPGGKFCDPDGQVKRIVKVGNVSDEILRITAIKVETSEIKSALTTT